MKPPVSKSEAIQAVAKVLVGHLVAIPGARRDYAERVQTLAVNPAWFRFLPDDITVEWDRGWAIGCGLTITFSPKLDVRVNWPSTNRTAGEAFAAAALYTQVAAVAAEIESFLARIDMEQS